MNRALGGDRLIKALLVSSLSCVSLYVLSAHYYDAQPFWFLNWNLVLAWLPLVFALILVNYLRGNPWVSWVGALFTVLWLAFLPNSFYLITDLIHLTFADPDQRLYYVIMLFSFSFNGLVLGYISLYLIHRQLLKRLKPRSAHLWVGTVLLLCSFAVYLGRYLRWSTWDIILHPIGVVFDVSDRIINPVAHGQTFQVTALFFILLSSMYFVLWHVAETLRENKRG